MEEVTGPEAKDLAESFRSPAPNSGSKTVARSLPFEKHFLDEFDDDSMPSPIRPPKIQTPSSKRLGHPTFMSSPSPAHKMPGSGTRSELYLKTVMSSPYQHKSYTPLSATPAGLSPMFQTPIRKATNSPSHMNTPQMNRLPPGFPQLTPKGEIISNPFDNGVYDELGGPIFMSPGVFSVQSTPDSEGKKLFSWAIEHIAELNPADIEENPKQQAAHSIPDRETEARVQRAIEKYFSTNLVAPSPWTDPKAPVIKTTPNSDERLPKACLEPDLQGSIQKQLPQTSIRTQEVGCQTMLTLPIDFDINKVLGQYMTYELCNDEGNQEMLSTSSLRRKLFFQADTSSLAPSPVKAGPFEGDHSLVDIGASPRVLPIKYAKLPETWDQATPLKTPSRNQFSSSPIKNIEGLPLPKHSHTPPVEDFSDSELSPIIRGHQSRFAKSRSSGFFVPHEGSFVEDDIFSGVEKRALFTQDLPLSPEISPIKSQINWDVSPEEGRHPSRTSLESPGISPIRSESPYNQDNADGSFLQDNNGFTSEEDDDVVTPVASKECSVKKKSVSTRKISHLSRHKHRTSLFQEDLDNTPMDYDSVPPIKNLRFADDIKTSSLLVTTKDFSMAEMDFSQDNNAGCSANQDTGYQTASLQSTNQEAGLHTNLTSQFNSLPFNTSNQEVGCPSVNMSCPSGDQQGDPLAGFSVEDSAFMSQDNSTGVDTDSNNKDVVQQLLDLTNLDKFEQEDEILDRARRALSMANKLLPGRDTAVFVGDTFPQKGLQILHELEPLVSPVEKPVHKGVTSLTDDAVSASEKALAILRRAGEDLAKIGGFLEQKP